MKENKAALNWICMQQKSLNTHLSDISKIKDKAEKEKAFKTLFETLSGLKSHTLLKTLLWRYQNAPLGEKNTYDQEFHPNSFIFHYGHLLSEKLLKAILSDEDLKPYILKDAKIHGMSYSLGRWPLTHLDIFKSVFQNELSIMAPTLLGYSAKGNPDWFTSNIDLVLSMPQERGSLPLWSGALYGMPERQRIQFIDRLLPHANDNNPNGAIHESIDPGCLRAIMSYANKEQIVTLLNMPNCVNGLKKQENYDVLSSLLGRFKDEKTVTSLLSQIKNCELITGYSLLKQRLSIKNPEEQRQFNTASEILLDCVRIKNQYDSELILAYDTLIVEEIFDKKYDSMGLGFFGHKTPTHIKALRALLGGQESIGYPLSQDIRESINRIAEDAIQSKRCLFNTRNARVDRLYHLIQETQTLAEKEVLLCGKNA